MYYNPADATREIKSRANDSANVAFTDHAEIQMQARQIDTRDALRTLRSGVVHDPGEIGEHGDYCYRVEAQMAKEILTVVACIPEDDPSLLVITAFRKSKRI